MPTDEERYQQHLRDIGGAPDTPEMRRAWEAEDRAGGGQAPGGGGWENQFRQTRREWENATHRTGEWDRWNPQQREEEFARHAQRLGYGSRQDLEDYLSGRPPVPTEGTYDVLMRQIADSRAAREGGLYQARSGDTLSSIASRFGLNVEDLLRWNPRPDPNLLRVGEIINLPSYTQAPSSPQRPTLIPSPGGLLGRPPEGQRGGRWVEEAIPMPSLLTNPAGYARWLAGEKTRRVYQEAPMEVVPPANLEWLQRRFGLTAEPTPPRPGGLPEEAGNWLERMRQALFPSTEPSLLPEEAARTWEGVTPEQIEQATAGRSLETLLGATEPLTWGYTYGARPLWQMMQGQAGAAPGMATPEIGPVEGQPFEALTPEEALQRGANIPIPQTQLPGYQLLQMMLGQAGAAPGMATPEVGPVEGQLFQGLAPEEAMRQGAQTPLGEFLARYWDVPITEVPALLSDPANLLLAPGLWRGGAAALRGIPGMARGAARGARGVAEELAPGARRLLAEEMGGIRLPRPSVTEMGTRVITTPKAIEQIDGISLGVNPQTKKVMVAVEGNRVVEFPKSHLRYTDAPDTEGLAAAREAINREIARMSPEAAAVVKQPWEMTQSEFFATPEGKPSVEFPINVKHRQAVTRAIVEGKPVPPEVLADYPDLAVGVGQAIPEAPRAVGVLPTAPEATGAVPTWNRTADAWAAESWSKFNSEQRASLLGRMGRNPSLAQLPWEELPSAEQARMTLLKFQADSAAKRGTSEFLDMLDATPSIGRLSEEEVARRYALNNAQGWITKGTTTTEPAWARGGPQIGPMPDYLPEFPEAPIAGGRYQVTRTAGKNTFIFEGEIERLYVAKNGVTMAVPKGTWESVTKNGEQLTGSALTRHVPATGKNETWERLTPKGQIVPEKPAVIPTTTPEEASVAEAIVEDIVAQGKLSEDDLANFWDGMKVTERQVFLQGIGEDKGLLGRSWADLPGNVQEKTRNIVEQVPPSDIPSGGFPPPEPPPPPGAPPPPTPPPPGGAPPPAAPNLTPDPRTFSQMIQTDIRDDVWRRFLALPIVRSFSLLVGGRLSFARTPVEIAEAGGLLLRYETQQMTTRAMANVWKLGSEGGVWGRITEKGEVQRLQANLSDILANPSQYPLNPRQAEWANTTRAILSAKEDLLRRNKVDITQLSIEKGGVYSGERLVVNGKGQIAYIGKGPQGAPVFSTMVAAQRQGYKVMPVNDVLARNVQGAYDAVSNAEIGEYLTQNVTWSPKGVAKGISLKVQGFENIVFTGPEAQELRETMSRFFSLTQPPAVRKILNAILRGVGNVNSIQRYYELAGDASPLTLQLLLRNAGHPLEAAKNTKMFFTAMFDTNAHAKFLASKEVQDLLLEFPSVKLALGGGTEFTEAMAPGGILRGTLLRPVGITVSPWQRGTDAAMDKAAVLILQSQRRMAKTAEQKASLSAYVNQIRGIMPTERLGVPETERLLERAVAISGQYNRAMVATVIDFFRGVVGTPAQLMGKEIPLRAQLARDDLLRGMAGVAIAMAAITYGVSKSKGKSDEEAMKDVLYDLDFVNNPNPLTVEIGGVKVGPGSKLRAMLKMFGQSVDDPESLLELTMNNPVLSFIRSNFAAGITLPTELWTGNDFSGDPTRNGLPALTKTLTKYFTPIALQTLLWEGGTIQQKLFRALAEEGGLRSSLVTWAQQRNGLREAYALSQYGVTWDKLKGAQKQRALREDSLLAEATQKAIGVWRGRANLADLERYDKLNTYWDSWREISERYDQQRMAVPIGQGYDISKLYNQEQEEIKALKKRLGLTNEEIFNRPEAPERGLTILDVAHNILQFVGLEEKPEVAGVQPRIPQSPAEIVRNYINGTIPELLHRTLGIPRVGLGIEVKGEPFNENEKTTFRDLDVEYNKLYDSTKDRNGVVDYESYLQKTTEFLGQLPLPLRERFLEYKARNQTPIDWARDEYQGWLNEYYALVDVDSNRLKEKRILWLQQNPPPSAGLIAARILNKHGSRFTEDPREVDHPNKYLAKEISDALAGLNIPTFDEYQRRRAAQHLKELYETGQPFYASSGALVDREHLEEFLLASKQMDEYMVWLEKVWRPSEGARNQRKALGAQYDVIDDLRNSVIDNPESTLEEKQQAYKDAKARKDEITAQREAIRVPVYQSAPPLVTKYFFGPLDKATRDWLESRPRPEQAEYMARYVPGVAPSVPAIPEVAPATTVPTTIPTQAVPTTVSTRQAVQGATVSQIFDTMPEVPKAPALSERPTAEEVRAYKAWVSETKDIRQQSKEWWETNRPRLIELGWREEPYKEEISRILDTKPKVPEGADADTRAEVNGKIRQWKAESYPTLMNLGWQPNPIYEEIDQIFEEYGQRKTQNKKDAYNWLEGMKPRLAELGYEFKDKRQPTVPTRPGEIVSTANVEWWDALTTEGTPEWRQEFENVHNRPPNNIDYFRDYLWSLDFQRSHGRGPSRAEWGQHYWDDVRQGRPRTRTPEFAPASSGNRTLTNAQWSNVQTLLGRTGTNELIGSRFIPDTMSEGTRNTLQRFYREHPYGARSFEDWLFMARAAYRREST